MDLIYPLFSFPLGRNISEDIAGEFKSQGEIISLWSTGSHIELSTPGTDSQRKWCLQTQLINSRKVWTNIESQ